MPHANSETMGEPVVNGEKVHSQFLNVSYGKRMSSTDNLEN